jgi:hypothetical protein
MNKVIKVYKENMQMIVSAETERQAEKIALKSYIFKRNFLITEIEEIYQNKDGNFVINYNEYDNDEY